MQEFESKYEVTIDKIEERYGKERRGALEGALEEIFTDMVEDMYSREAWDELEDLDRKVSEFLEETLLCGKKAKLTEEEFEIG